MINQETILRRVVDLYGAYGIKVCSMDDVARACGISKKTLYGYFENKYELVQTLVAGITTWFSAEYKTIANTSPNAVQEVFSSIVMLESLYRKLHYRMFEDMERHYYQIWRKVDSFRREAGLELITANILRGRNEGLFIEDFDYQVIGKMRLCHLDNIHRHALETGDLHKTLLETTRHYLAGMATKKGFHEINKFLDTIQSDNQK